jgi:hypothetical protein
VSTGPTALAYPAAPFAEEWTGRRSRAGRRSDDPVAALLRPVVISLKRGGASVHRENYGRSNFVIR